MRDKRNQLAISFQESSIGRDGTQRNGIGPNILVVEDDPDTLELIAFNVAGAGYRVITAGDAREALKKARGNPLHLVVLDLMLPDMDGYDLCKIWRGDSRTCRMPILILTARTSEVDRILGLELGANDYMTKPFSPRELLLRIRNLLPETQDCERADVLHCGDLHIDVPRRAVRVGQHRVILTATEFRILSLLARRKGEVQTRGQLQEELLVKSGRPESRTIDTHVQRLRQKLGLTSCSINTIRGVGYRLLESPSDSTV